VKEFRLEILTPARRFYSGAVWSIGFQTSDGGIEILAGHAPTALPVQSAPITLRGPEGLRLAALTEGFALVGPEKVEFYVDTAEWPGEIDRERASRAEQRAETRLATDTFEWEKARTRAALARARSRLEAVDRSAATGAGS
jgi:F-type H+-transporting ATPase subunit epsilon